MTILEAINAERLKAGASPLSYRSDIQASANLRAQEASQLWSHTRPNGQPYYSADNRIYGENLAKGYKKDEQIMTAWMNSKSHRENMLNGKYKGVCFGRYVKSGEEYIAMELTL